MIATLVAIACVAWLSYRIGYDEGQESGRWKERSRSRRQPAGEPFHVIEGRRLRS